ncbi:MAG: hypothetical protein ACQETB_05345 [Halobacteriota archaeon]
MSGGDSTEGFDEEIEAQTWPELAIAVYDRLTGRGAEITYEFEDMEIDVPSKIGEDAQHANWRVDGTLKVSTKEKTQ